MSRETLKRAPALNIPVLCTGNCCSFQFCSFFLVLGGLISISKYKLNSYIVVCLRVSACVCIFASCFTSSFYTQYWWLRHAQYDENEKQQQLKYFMNCLCELERGYSRGLDPVLPEVGLPSVYGESATTILSRALALQEKMQNYLQSLCTCPFTRLIRTKSNARE